MIPFPSSCCRITPNYMSGPTWPATPSYMNKKVLFRDRAKAVVSSYSSSFLVKGVLLSGVCDSFKQAIIYFKAFMI